MPKVSIEIEVFCAQCGAGLCNQSTGGSKRGIPNISVEPCQSCINNERKEAYDEGYTEAENRFQKE